MLKRALRRLRTWAPPISLGVIVGAGAFIIAERIAPPSQAAPMAIERPAQRAEAPRLLEVAEHREPRPLFIETSRASPSRAYSDCDAARAAGAAPVYEGEPGFGPHLDGDGDGIGCEPYRGR